jgi:hypothetical protein
LTEIQALRTASSISFSWTPAFDGGNDIIDYSIYDAFNLETPVLLAENIVETSYTATGLTFGETYVFKVAARNEFGLSDLSALVGILCASRPETPA